MEPSSLLKGFLVENFSGFPVRSLPFFIASFIICAVLAFLLSRIYIRFGSSLSNRRAFGRNFVLLAITTMFIISVVKSSLALSLGLVGALSIVRFRAAIKEPEELTYLFLTIAIGLGCGAGLPIVTTIAFAGFVLVIWMVNRYKRETQGQSLYLTFAGGGEQIDPDTLNNLLVRHSLSVKLKRLDDRAGIEEYSYLLEIESLNDVNLLRRELKKEYPEASFSLLDSSRDF